MTDSKRNATLGKVVTPKAGIPTRDLPDAGEALYRAVGARIQVTVAPNNVSHEGTIFAVSPEMNLLAMNTAMPPQNPSTSVFVQSGDFHIIPIHHLTSFSLLSSGEGTGKLTDGFDLVQPSIERLDVNALRQREDTAVGKLKERQAMKGKGVGKEGQEMFDALARTLPCRWHGTTIIVNEAVMIQPPYRLEDCQAPKDKQQGLAHVKKIMEAYLARKGRPIPNVNRSAVVVPIPLRKGG